MPSQTLPLFVFASVILCWFVLGAVFLLGKRAREIAGTRRDPRARTGVALVSIGYGIVWMGQRDWTHSLFPGGETIELVLAFLTVILGLVSVLIVLASVRTLGKHRRLTPRAAEGPQLVTDGPFRFVRHPLYTGMFGLLLATGLALSEWYALIVAGVIFWIGITLRITVEERFLREEFGDAYDRYAEKTPPLFPRFV